MQLRDESLNISSVKTFLSEFCIPNIGFIKDYFSVLFVSVTCAVWEIFLVAFTSVFTSVSPSLAFSKVHSHASMALMDSLMGQRQISLSYREKAKWRFILTTTYQNKVDRHDIDGIKEPSDLFRESFIRPQHGVSFGVLIQNLSICPVVLDLKDGNQKLQAAL